MVSKRSHDENAPFWAFGLVVLCGTGLATVWINLGSFWSGYVLDMTGPAWNYILFRGLYTKQTQNKWTDLFTPHNTLILFLFVCIGIEGAQYFNLYDSTYDPLDFVAYISILIPLYIIDLLIIHSRK